MMEFRKYCYAVGLLMALVQVIVEKIETNKNNLNNIIDNFLLIYNI